jgi:archaellum biogenesis ATPase FlaH
MTYTVDVQKLFLQFMLSDAQLYTRVQNIFNAENFDKSLRKVAKFIHEHSQNHNVLPDRQQIYAVTQTTLEPIEDIKEGHVTWFLEEFENFTKRQELERAIITSADLLEKGEFDPVEKLIKDAVQIGLTRNMGTDYFKNPRERLLSIKNANGQTSTGWPELDFALFGGFNRGELNIFYGLPGAGKSLFMQNLTCNWLASGLNGIYISHELSENLISMRLDSMITGICSKEIFKELDDVELKVMMHAKKSGKLRIKFLPAGSTVNDLRAYVRELKIREDFKADFMMNDYLDLMNPYSQKINASDAFTKDKLVSEELRNFYIEEQYLAATASQFNRSGVDELEFSMAQGAGGISKFNTADNVFGIYTSIAMKERGKYQLQLMKTRNSSGLGKKVDLEYDVNTLKITGQEQTADTRKTTGTEILDKIKTGAYKMNGPDNPIGEPKVKAEVQSNKLQNLLSQIRKNG